MVVLRLSTWSWRAATRFSRVLLLPDLAINMTRKMTTAIAPIRRGLKIGDFRKPPDLTGRFLAEILSRYA